MKDERQSFQPERRPPVVIANNSLYRKKRRVALVTLWLPVAGTLGAAAFALHYGVGGVEAGLLVGMFVLTTAGVEVGFHRLFSHKAFEAPLAIRGLLFILGCMAVQGRGIYWAGNHRRHHAHSDTPDDPHSPRVRRGPKGAERLFGLKGFWHAHQGNTYTALATNSALFANDLGRESLLVRLDALYPVWVALGFAIPSAVGALAHGSWVGAVNGFFWGGIVRVFVGHQTYFTNGSFGHMYGSQPFDNGDDSRNNLWCALPTFGSAYQNNHHAFPYSAKLGLRWWQLDIGWLFIRALQAIGAVRKVRVPSTEQMKQALAARANVDRPQP